MLFILNKASEDGFREGRFIHNEDCVEKAAVLPELAFWIWNFVVFGSIFEALREGLVEMMSAQWIQGPDGMVDED
ncbi:unnamed protein product [Toxocara canis]|uniref:Ion_trans domain-containing protein n=1 Tax=Toxocara canis TaxID=6265 RepID=A0A183U7E6_TOXCA|nr:unnamed protein product [Toxocara canis]